MCVASEGKGGIRVVLHKQNVITFGPTQQLAIAVCRDLSCRTEKGKEGGLIKCKVNNVVRGRADQMTPTCQGRQCYVLRAAGCFWPETSTFRLHAAEANDGQWWYNGISVNAQGYVQ